MITVYMGQAFPQNFLCIKALVAIAPSLPPKVCVTVTSRYMQKNYRIKDSGSVLKAEAVCKLTILSLAVDC